MKAIQVKQVGGPEAMQLVDLPVPQPKSHEALVKIAASGVNFIDVYIREGRYHAPVPFVVGQEGSGVVTAVGPDVKTAKVGNRVAWSGALGSYAEYVAAPAAALVPVPEDVGDRDAAGAMLQGMTAHYLCYDTYPLTPGKTALIHAGAGGVGLLLIQIAKMRGARVLTTVSTDTKAELARGAGADRVILYTTESFVEAVKKETGGEGLPVVYDSVGKTTFEDSLKCLRPRGLMALFGGSSGAVPPFDLIRLSQMGSLYVTRPTMKDYIRTRTELERRVQDVFGWVKDGKLRVRIGHRYKLEEAAQAHIDLQARKTTGKVLLTI
jgi:NADPH2:quinone reductase